MKERYLRSVRMLMDCPPKEKERLLSRLGSAIEAYLEDVPEAGEADIIASFGTPEECAAKLSAECAPTDVAAQRRKKTRRHRIIMGVLLALVVIFMGISLYLHSTGGLVIITSGRGMPDYMKDMPSDHIIYAYDD